MVLHLYRTILFLFLFLLPSISTAQEMTSCIEIGRAVKPSTGVEGTYLLNTCDHAAFTFWCHDGTGDSACGTEKHFKRGRKMQPDERYFNKYSLPGNAAVHLGACMGTKRNVSFGKKDIKTYSCIKNDTSVFQSNDHPPTLECVDGRKLSYQWQKMYVRGGITVVKLKTKGQVSWVKVDTPDLNEFTSNDKGIVKNTFTNLICNEKTTKANFYERQKKNVLDKLNEKHNDRRTECLEALERSDECTKFLKPKHSGTSGVQG